MNKRREENQRVKSSITNALLELLRQKNISDISITEIVERAGVARASFYRNYASKESVLTTLIDDVLEDYRSTLRDVREYFYTYENVMRSFEYFKRYGKYALELHKLGYGSLILEKLNQFHEEVAGTMPYNSIERYRLYIYIGALYNTAMVWLQNGADKSVQEITDMFYAICVLPTGAGAMENRE